jgi:hypothetical protein
VDVAQDIHFKPTGQKAEFVFFGENRTDFTLSSALGLFKSSE